MRRFVVFAYLLALANLSFARGEWSCPRHDSNTADQAAQTESSAHHHGQDEHSDRTPADRGPQPDCCQAMTACSGAAVLPPPGSTLIADVPTTTRLMLAPSLFVSRVESPDPPPPKA